MSPRIVHDVLRSPGQTLDTPAGAFMESRFGHDFGHVRIHTDSHAAEAQTRCARDRLDGRTGHRVRRRPYAPHTRGGLRLLAHVVQQGDAEAAAGAHLPY